MTISDRQIHRTILLFWTAWFAVVTLTNICDALVASAILPAGWRFASGNYGLIKEVTGRYATPGWLLPPLFAGVIVWEALASVLFLRAWIGWPAGGDSADARLAYVAALGLWAAFLLTDELFISYQVEGAHLRFFIAHLVCLVGLTAAVGRSPE